MSRAAALLGSLVFLVLAPGTVAGIVPFWISRWRMRPPFLGFAGFRIGGVVLIGLGGARAPEADEQVPERVTIGG